MRWRVDLVNCTKASIGTATIATRLGVTHWCGVARASRHPFKEERLGAVVEAIPIPVVTPAPNRSPVSGLLSDKESTFPASSRRCEVAIETGAGRGPVKVVREGNETEEAEKVAKMAIRMLKAVTETGKVGPAIGVTKVIETVDASLVGSPKFEVA
ncbi:hypothetical protein Nepgr_027367 [Nepenthes gracilis]|uniref:Uncharacterized protein n=1 Tax=Nepenthes gracilis TaxID=150966 RepID=A0AAD3TA80_NEPGR|nr:hypothetical protein Nepgr_027367 [Nepenthes gracilis]